MSISIETIIHCDGKECPRQGEPLGAADNRQWNARRQLKESGWISRAGKHYCPACKPSESDENMSVTPAERITVKAKVNIREGKLRIIDPDEKCERCGGSGKVPRPFKQTGYSLGEAAIKDDCPDCKKDGET